MIYFTKITCKECKKRSKLTEYEFFHLNEIYKGIGEYAICPNCGVEL